VSWLYPNKIWITNQITLFYSTTFRHRWNIQTTPVENVSPQTQTFSASPAKIWPWVFDCWLLRLFHICSNWKNAIHVNHKRLKRVSELLHPHSWSCLIAREAVLILNDRGSLRDLSHEFAGREVSHWAAPEFLQLIHNFRNEELGALREWDQSLLRTSWLSGSMNTHIRHHWTFEKNDMCFLCCLWNAGPTRTLGDIFSQRPSKEKKGTFFPQVCLVLGHCNFQTKLPSFRIWICSNAPGSMCPSEIKIMFFKKVTFSSSGL
jgi:hypothetical protein